MPVTKLYVEGSLDQQVLNFILGGTVAVQKVGGKYALQAVVLREREELPAEERRSVCYLRDRDFDFRPEADEPDAPKPLTTKGGELVGYRWRRHSMENYFLEPALAAKALERDEAQLANLLAQAGNALADYESARWTIGQARLSVPPARELETRPRGLEDEFKLPSDVSSGACLAWIEAAANEFVAPIQEALAPRYLRQVFGEFQMNITGLEVSGVLVWFSGKDLMAFIAPRLGLESPRTIRNEIRNWIQRNPDAALALLPEWSELKRLLAQ
jgi:hypothetical protein